MQEWDFQGPLDLRDAAFVGPWDGCGRNFKDVASGDKVIGLLYRHVTYRIRIGDSENNYLDSSPWYVIADGGYLHWPWISSK